MMDLQTCLLCVTLALLSGLLIYGIMSSTMKEKTYDEAMADRRRKTEEQFPQTRSAKEKAKDKKLKKAGKKVKEKANSDRQNSESTSESERSKAHVVFVEEQVAVATDEPIKVEEKEQKKPKKKEKSILLNKSEPRLLADNPPPVLNTFEQIHPKDDFELKRSHSREDVDKSTGAEEASIPPMKEKQTASRQPKSAPSKQQPQEQQQKAEKQQQNQQKNPGATEKSTHKAEKSTKQEIKEPVVKLSVAKPQQAQPPSQESQIVTSAAPIPSQSEKVNVSPSVKISKKKRSELATLQQMTSDCEGINVSLLIPLVRKAELSRSEVQLLTDILLNKQLDSTDSSSEWIEGRQDPMVKLKKQLAEKERALTEEQEASTGLQSKLKELRIELNSEKHTVRTLEDAIQGRQNEISSFAIKLQHASEEKQTLAQQIQQLQSKLGEERRVVLKLQEESAQSQGVLQQELLAQRQQLELHIARLGEQQHQQQETIGALEAQLGGQMQEHEGLTSELTILRERTTHLQDSAAQSQDLIRQLEEMRNVQADLEHMLGAAQFEANSLQTEVSEITEQLSIQRNENEKLNAAIQSFQGENTRLREANERLTLQASSACVEARQLRDENETLAAQVTASMERPATEGRENGDANNYSENKHSHIEDEDSIQKKDLLLEEINSQLKAKELMVESLTSEVNTHKTEVLEQQRLLQGLREEVAKHKEEADRLSAELLQQTTQVSRIAEQLQSQQSKNNELRTKNWKVMEALSTTENLLQCKVKESQRIVNEAVEKALLEQQSSTRKLLLRIFPEFNVPESEDQHAWFKQFESALSAWKPQQGQGEDQSSFIELEKQNIQLQAMVTHYKKIIADTEGMLNRLQSHVEQEEGKWGEELQSLQSQLEIVTQERDALASSGAHQKPNGYYLVDTASQTSSKRRRFTGWLRKRIGLTKKKKSRKRRDSVSSM